MVGEEAWSVLAGGWRWREPEVADYSVFGATRVSELGSGARL